MRKYRLFLGMLLGITVVAGSATTALSDTTLAAPSAGTARVWFLRPADSASSTDWGAVPIIYANGAPIAELSADTAFYRDFAPGTYRFTVQSYGLPTGQADTVQLAPGTQTYIEVQWADTWAEGYASGSGGLSQSFFTMELSPQLAHAWLASLTDLGRR
jgi:transglutaminase-like putative cysteine protease